MVDVCNYPNAYSEVLEILKYIPNEDFEKIPTYIIDGFNEYRNPNYVYDINKFKQNIMLYETQVILAILFRDYWATEEQRKKIIANENYNLQIIENNKKEKINCDNLFKNKKVENTKIVSEVAIIKCEESFWKRIINKLKGIFKI